MGGGSAEIKALYEITPLMGIKKLLGGNADVTYVKGYEADDFEESGNDVNWQTALKMAAVRLPEGRQAALSF